MVEIFDPEIIVYYHEPVVDGCRGRLWSQINSPFGLLDRIEFLRVYRLILELDISIELVSIRGNNFRAVGHQV
jgi:hypothetical protein